MVKIHLSLFFVLKPITVCFAITFNRMVLVDKCSKLNSLDILQHYVPFPEPGPPITKITLF